MIEQVEENGLKYIRAEPALTLRLAKAAIDAAKALEKKSSSTGAVGTAGVAVVGVEGQIEDGSGDGGVVAFTPVSSTSTSKGGGMAVGAGGGGVEKAQAQGIDWGLLIAEAGKEGDITGDATLFDDKVLVEGSKEGNEFNVVEQEEGEEEDDEEEEDNIDSTEFDEVIEVEDVFGKEIAERATDSRRINSIEEGEEGEENDEDESEDEETDDSEDEEESDDGNTDNTVNKTPDIPVLAVPAQTGDINFSEDFFPVLSAEGPKRAKKVWPAPTNENIDRTPVTLTAAISSASTSNSDGTGPVGDAVEGGEGVSVSGGEVPKSVQWGAGTGAGVKNWSQVAALSVKAAVETATDNSHTMTNRYA